MKRGVSLIVLGITMIVLSILAGIVVFSAKDAISISKEGNFKTNMAKIQDAAVEYYATCGVLPIKNNATALTKSELLAKANLTVDKYEALSVQITANGDDAGKFYALDIEKLNIQETVYNITKDSDVLYINDMGTCVYYITGFTAGDDVYFSLDVHTER